MGRVLLVEDDLAIAQPLARALEREGHDVNVAADGLEVCRTLRSEDARLPILILTARGSEMDVVVGFEMGADDYVSKPFRSKELMARIRSLLRRGQVGEINTIRVQDVVLDANARKAWVGTRELTLSRMEFDLLHALMREHGTTVPRERLMREVWNTHWYGSSKTLDMHVSWLRRKLGDSATDSRYISTVRGVGLRFESQAGE